MVDDVGGRTCELNGTRERIAIAQSPFSRELEELLIRQSVQLHKSLLDDRLVLSVSSFNVHHHGNRNATGSPLVDRGVQVGDGGHHAVQAFVDENTSIVAEGVAVVGIEARRQATATFVAEEVTERVEAAVVLSLLLQLLQLLLDTADDELFSFDLGDLDITVGIAIQRQLVTQGLGQVVEQVSALFLELAGDFFLTARTLSNHFVQLLDQGAHFRNELDQTFGKQDDTVVLANLASLHDQFHDFLGDLLDRLLLLLDLLADEGEVGVGLEGTFHGDVGGGAAHQTNEVVVLLGGESIHANIANQFGVDFASGVETEGDGDVVVLQVTVDGLGTANDVGAVVNALEILGKQGSVGVGVISTNHNETVQVEVVADLGGGLELVVSLDLITARADHIESTHISVLVHELVIDLDVLSSENATRTVAEAIHIAADLLDKVVNTSNDVMTAGSLTTGKNNTNVHGSPLLLLAFFIFYTRKTIGARKKGFDLFYFITLPKQNVP